MREFINRLSRGKFNTKIPVPDYEKRIVMDVISGQTDMGEFYLQADIPLKGVVYSSNVRVTVENNSFAGEQVVIHFKVDASELAEKEQIDGIFTFVSNAGEFEVPYVFTGVEYGIETSIGKACNMFHFANLAQKSMEEAISVFKSEEFKTVILKNDANYLNIYNLLIGNNSVEQAIDEFMIAVKKKSAVTFRLCGHSKEYSDLAADEKDSFVIEKSGWGYIEFNIQSDSDFIELSHDRITSDDFTGDRYELEYMLRLDKCHNGRNYGRITVSAFNHCESFEIEVYRVNKDILNSGAAVDPSIKEIRVARVSLTKEYLNFRMRKTKKESWVSHSEKIIKRVRGLGVNDAFFELAQAQFDFISGRETDGNWILNNLKPDMVDVINRDANLYCYYLYINTLARRNEEYTKEVINTVRGIYENGHDTWQILWLLFYLSDETESNKSIKLIRMKDAFNDGCISPVLYLEAINILNSQPILLRVLNKFEMQVLLFGCKYNLIQEKLAVQAADIINNEKLAGDAHITILGRLYELYDNDEILNCLVTQMVRNGYVSEKYFEIYEKGILRGLKITRLYEYYVASMVKDLDKKIPKMVLMYFAYDNSQEFRYRDFLYANVVVNKSSYKDVYNSYEKIIEMYVYEQMKAGNINRYLTILYKEFMKPSMIVAETAPFLSEADYLYRVNCFDEGIKEVLVSHSEFKDIAYYEVVDNCAYVKMYSDNCTVAFKCKDGSIRRDSVNYELEKVFTECQDWEMAEQFNVKSDGLVVCRVQKLHKMGCNTVVMLNAIKEALCLSSINDRFKIILNSWLIDYLYEFYDGENIASEYSYVSTKKLNNRQTVKITETLIREGLYDKAYELVSCCGYRNVSAAKLLKLISNVIENISDEYSELMIGMSGYVFEQHIFNEIILNYMIDYYNGTNESMYNVWKSAYNFGLEVNPLSERLIAQMLFTGVHSGRLTEVFTDYYKKGASRLLIKAYAAYNAFLYVLKQKKANDIVFKVITDCINEDIGLPEVCLVAWLKEKSRHISDIKGNEERELLQKVFDSMCRQDRLYSFYSQFQGALRMPYNIIGATVLECIANPESKVTIHYVVNDCDDEYREEICKNNEWGIFTFKIMLFYGDRLKYYFTIEEGGKERKTEQLSYECSVLGPDHSQGRLDAINDCIASRELHDNVTLKKLMHSYSVENYVVTQLFKPTR
ncbi:MAG: DUF5717 family protein [Lachnospira sp.]